MDSFESTRQDKQIAALQAYIDKLEDIISMIPGNVWWKDINGFYEGCNGNLASILKLNHWKNIIGKTDVELQQDEALVKPTLENDHFVTSNNQESVFLETGFDDKRQKAYYLTRKKPMLDHDGNVIGLIGMSIDITDRKRLEELSRKNEIANQVIQRLKAISAGLSYEVRGPLAGIRLGLGRTKQLFGKLLRFVKSMGGRIKSADDEEVSLEELVEYQQLLDKMVQRIDASVALMDMQLKNMMTDRIEQRFFQPQKIRYSIEQAVKTFPVVDEALRDKIQLNIQHDFSVCGDALLTKHLLWNLLHNALHAIQEGGQGEIFITTEEMIDYHLLRFKYTGRGMATTQFDGMFESFAASDNGNNGLGLHFCQLVMKAYGGKIERYAKEGQGAEFLLFFPTTSS